MKYYILNNATILKEKDTNLYFIDLDNNEIETTEYEVFKLLKLKKVFLINNYSEDSTFKHLITNKKLNYQLINKDGYKYRDILDNLVNDSQFIELLVFQFILDENLNTKNSSYLKYFDDLEILKQEGSINSNEFSSLLNNFKDKTSQKALNTILYHTHIKSLFEFVRTEIYHAEYCLQTMVDNMLNILVSKAEKIV